jgi:Bacterial tandem repeat domain 1
MKIKPMLASLMLAGCSLASISDALAAKMYSAVLRVSDASVRFSGGLDKDTFTQRIRDRAEDGYRLRKLDVDYTDQGDYRYTGVWEKTEMPTRYALDLSRSEFFDKLEAAEDSGYSLISFEIDNRRYSAVWQKDGKADKLVTRKTYEEFQEENSRLGDDEMELYQMGFDSEAAPAGYFGLFRPSEIFGGFG